MPPHSGGAVHTGAKAAARPGPGLRPEWIAAAALAALGLLLYARGLFLGYVGDDWTLLDAALRTPLGELLTGRHGILGYYRPVSRELYFWWWGKLLNFGPAGFHVVNAVTFAATIVMLARLARDLAGPRAAHLAAALLLVFPAGSALLAWISCAQDLIALFWSAAALLLYARGRHVFAGLAVLLAALSKETAAVLPAAIVALEWQRASRAPWRERAGRLWPAFAGLVAAIAIALAARATWPPGTAITIWSPRQLAGAWHLPLDLLRTWLPPDIGPGLAQLLVDQPLLPVLIAAVAALAALPMRRALAGSAQSPNLRAAVVVGVTLAIVAMLPVGFIVERWRGYFFSLSALGMSLAGGALLSRAPAPLARAAIAALALINFGAGGIYRPIEAPSGPARHPHVNYAFFRETGVLTGRMIAALEPWCGSLRSVPRTFAAGVPPDATFESVLGPGLRVTCRDTVARVRFLADFTPADATSEFGVLRFDAANLRFVHERADAAVRARIGEGFLVYARYDVAAACFAAAAAGRPADRELGYPLTIALAAAGRGAAAESTWRVHVRAGALPDAATMAARLAGRRTAAPGDTAARALTPLAAAALAAPWRPEPHRALGSALLAGGRAREAAIELATAAGITRKGEDLARLGQAFDALGATDQAHGAYQQALTLGLPRDIYPAIRDRYFTLERQRAASGPSSGRP